MKVGGTLSVVKEKKNEEKDTILQEKELGNKNGEVEKMAEYASPH